MPMEIEENASRASTQFCVFHKLDKCESKFKCDILLCLSVIPHIDIVNPFIDRWFGVWGGSPLEIEKSTLTEQLKVECKDGKMSSRSPVSMKKMFRYCDFFCSHQGLI